MRATVALLAAAALTVALAASGRESRPYTPLRPEGPARDVVVGPSSLQAALDAARPGDTLTLQAGETYTGPFHLPKKDGNGWIVIRTDDLRGLPEPGERFDPARWHGLPKLVSASASVLIADSGAHHYRFVGLEIAPTPDTFLYNVVQLGLDETTTAAVPHDLIFERCYIHGDPAKGSRRGILLNSASTTVVDSYLSDFKEVGADSQAILGWNGPGPFVITNNYLEGAGENILFGGAVPTIPGLVPTDIQIRRNRFAKPLAWRIESRDYQGTPWTVKNLFELKNARRVVVDGNVFEYNWPHAQNGFAILFTPRGETGAAAWATVEDVAFTNNLVHHVAAGVNILGVDDLGPSGPAHRIVIRNNLFLDVGGQWGFGRLFQLLNGAADITIDHNTGMQTENLLFTGDTTPHPHFVFTNNIAMQGPYGVIGSSTGVGLPSIERYLPGAVFRRNAIVGGKGTPYPGDNFFPDTVDAIGFTSVSRGDLHLLPSSPFKHAGTDGADLGADMDSVKAASLPGVGIPRPGRAAGPGGRRD